MRSISWLVCRVRRELGLALKDLMDLLTWIQDYPTTGGRRKFERSYNGKKSYYGWYSQVSGKVTIQTTHLYPHVCSYPREDPRSAFFSTRVTGQSVPALLTVRRKMTRLYLPHKALLEFTLHTNRDGRKWGPFLATWMLWEPVFFLQRWE